MRKPKGSNKKVGYILLPIFVNVAKGETVEEATDRTDFEEVWNVLQAMQEQDSMLAKVIQEMRIEKGKKGSFSDKGLTDFIEFIGPELSVEQIREA